MEENNLKELTGKEILNELCGKELNSKKNILEAIEKIKPLAKEGLESDKIQEIYNVIYKSIEEMNTIVKANTIMYLKNQLKSALGKFVENKDPKEMNYFLEFFKEAYPPNNRRVGYTRVINDFSIFNVCSLPKPNSPPPNNKITFLFKLRLNEFIISSLL